MVIHRRVIALTLEGEKLWISEEMAGKAVGTPLISENGNYIFVNTSQSKWLGRFNILQNSKLFYVKLDGSCPYAPPSIYYNPIRGNYDGGEDNTNDLVMWSCDGTDPPIDGMGGIYAFQFPVGFDDTIVGVDVVRIGDGPTDFWGKTAPVISNNGLSVYWTSSTSRYYAWLDDLFEKTPTGVKEFTRSSSFRRQPIFTPPALSNEPIPMVFGGTATNQFVRLNHDFSQTLAVNTNTVVRGRAVVAPSNDFVYYVEQAGILHQAKTSNLVDQWTTFVGAGAVSDIALDSSGLFLYVGDNVGVVRGYFMGDPTASPTIADSLSPTITPQPTKQPSQYPSMAPSSKPSEAPSSGPSTTAPTLSKEPSTGPSNQASDIPSSNPSTQPSLVISSSPSTTPSVSRSREPSRNPSEHPSMSPSLFLSQVPSIRPSEHPSMSPSLFLSQVPSQRPSESISMTPSEQPSKLPTQSPTITSFPSEEPVSQCTSYGSQCVWSEECCSNRCVLGSCQKKITTRKEKLGGAGRGGAAGGSSRARIGNTYSND